MSRQKGRPRFAVKEECFEQEVSFHVEEMTRANIATGMTPGEARRRAQIDFGRTEQIKQRLREVHSFALLESLQANLRAAVRFIRRSPTFATSIVLTLALGIGVNSAVFSAIDAILLRPLSFPHGDELVALEQHDLRSKSALTLVATQRLEDWNRLTSSFQSVSGYYTGVASFTSGALPEKVSMAFVAPRFLQLWQVAPELGRDFTREEWHFGGPLAVLVSDRFWRAHLNGDPGIIGKTLRLGSTSYLVTGVMPASFLFPVRDVDLWTPNPVDAPYSQSRESTWFTVIGRLKPGVTLSQARADLGRVQGALGREFPKSDGSLSVGIKPLKSIVVGRVGSSLWLLYGSVSLLLLIACTNIAALLLARTAEREHEIAIRYSLGGSRSAIVGQLLTEVFLLALTGSLLGLLLAAGSAHAFSLFSKDLPRLAEIRLNWRVAGYALGCALAATFACGLIPALRGSRMHLASTMATGSRTQVSGRNAWQWSLVGVQVSLAVALLIGAGLLLRSFEALARVNLGFDPGHVLTLKISGSWGETADMGRLLQRIDRTLEGLRSVPGVEAAATSGTIPGNASDYPTEVKISEGPKEVGRILLADAHFVSAGYFATVHIPVLQGVACQAGLMNGVLVNRSFVQKYLSGRSALGYHIEDAAAGSLIKPQEILGVTGDAREQGIDVPAQPTLYWCYSAPSPDPNYLVRTHGDPSVMVNALREKIHQLEPTRSVSDVMPLEDHLDDRFAENRLRTILLSLFALTAISLVSIGLYGTISYLGRTRRREIGVRLALGALPRQIIARFLLQGLRVTLTGCTVGLLLGVAMGRFLLAMLYEISPIDPATYAGVLSLTVIIAITATLFPAIRAVRVNPNEILREE